MQRQQSYPGGGGWAIGLTFFASMLMVLTGGFHFVEGLGAIFNDDFFVGRHDFGLNIDTSTWGWIQIAIGIAMVWAGIWLFKGSLAARVLTIIAAVLSGLWGFYSVAYYPVWSVLIIALSIGVIWAMTTNTEDFA